MRAHRLLPALLLLGLTLPAHADTLWDNGLPDGVGSRSNVTEGVFGARRTVLDDFTVPAGQVWRIEQFSHRHVWNSLPPGTGLGLELLIRADDGSQPGKPITEIIPVTAYSEEATGEIYFNRPEALSWTTFESFELEAGHYWFEGTIVGPENNFWLIHLPVRGFEHWVNYEDLGGLQPGTDVFGYASDLNFQVHGTIVIGCPGDINSSGTVDFADLLEILSLFGPCDHHSGCPEDINNDGIVDFADLLLLLAAWGACD